MTPKPTDEIYAIFCGDINAANSQKLAVALTTVINGGVPRLHLLFHTWGGFPGDGVFMFNMFRSLPLEVVLYNVGQVASAGVVAYLGAKKRIATKHASFMIHRAHNSPIGANSSKLQAISKSLTHDDSRMESILSENAQIPSELWEHAAHHDTFFSGEDAVKYGVAHEIGEFAPPIGVQVHNVIA